VVVNCIVVNLICSNECPGLAETVRIGVHVSSIVLVCRRALMQYLESRVTPLLAGILAYVDTNNNLDVLESAVHNTEHWLHHMWLHMLSDSKVTVLKYR